MTNPTGLDSRRIQNWIALTLITFFVVFGMLSVQKVSTTFDEDQHYRYGKNILNLNSTRFDDSKMPVSAWNALPAKIASRLPDGWLRNFLSEFFVARWMTILFSALVAYLVFHWARVMYGFYAGLAALFLYIFDPNIIAHSQLVTTDIYVTGTILFACYWAWKFANTRSLYDGMSSAFMLGFSQLAKYTSIVLLPLLLLALVLHDLPAQISAYKEKGYAAIARYLGQLILYTAAGGIAIFLLINVGFLFNRPLVALHKYDFESGFFTSIQNIKIFQNFHVPVPYPYLQGLDRVMFKERINAGNGANYLLGHLSVKQGFPGYYFIASALKVPIATQVILIAAFVAYIVNKQRRKSLLQNEIFLLAPVAFFTIYFNFFYNAQIGIRFYLVVFPLIYVFAGSLFAGWPGFSRNQKIAVFALAVYLVASVLSYYPFYLSYFNEIVWDRKYAYKYLVDSNLDWGQGQYYLRDYMTLHPDAIYEPKQPVSGLLIVSPNDLVGSTTWDNIDHYKWLRDNFQPVTTIAYEYVVYDVSPQALQKICAGTTDCH